MDPDSELVCGYFKHLFPDFSINHFLVYKLLWRIEPKSPEAVIGEAKLARATTYKILNELVAPLKISPYPEVVCYHA